LRGRARPSGGRAKSTSPPGKRRGSPGRRFSRRSTGASSSSQGGRTGRSRPSATWARSGRKGCRSCSSRRACGSSASTGTGRRWCRSARSRGSSRRGGGSTVHAAFGRGNRQAAWRLAGRILWCMEEARVALLMNWSGSARGRATRVQLELDQQLVLWDVVGLREDKVPQGARRRQLCPGEFLQVYDVDKLWCLIGRLHYARL